MFKTVLLFFVLIETVFLEESTNNKFVVVSSTETPNFTNDRLTRIENKLKDIELKLDKIQQSSKSIPRNCKEVQESGHTNSGLYRIQPSLAIQSFLVLCDMTTHGGGWTYFLNRFDGSQNFFKNWVDYREGFGNLAGEFWLGLERLHLLTGYEPNELLVEMVDWNSTEKYAMYSAFSISGEFEGYAIKVLGGYNGTAGDSLKNHTGMKFSTDDKDQDGNSEFDCASFYKGAWWYNSCSFSDLTGTYHKGKVDEKPPSVMYWDTFTGDSHALKEARMMVRPRSSTTSNFLPHRQ